MCSWRLRDYKDAPTYCFNGPVSFATCKVSWPRFHLQNNWSTFLLFPPLYLNWCQVLLSVISNVCCPFAREAFLRCVLCTFGAIYWGVNGLDSKATPSWKVPVFSLFIFLLRWISPVCFFFKQKQKNYWMHCTKSPAVYQRFSHSTVAAHMMNGSFSDSVLVKLISLTYRLDQEAGPLHGETRRCTWTDSK